VGQTEFFEKYTNIQEKFGVVPHKIYLLKPYVLDSRAAKLYSVFFGIFGGTRIYTYSTA